MTPTTVIDLGRQALELTLLVSAPLFIAALATGLIISIFQAATQINEYPDQRADPVLCPQTDRHLHHPGAGRAVDDHDDDRLHPTPVREHSGHDRLSLPTPC